MKRVITLALLIFFYYQHVKAQEIVHEHKGFYLSMAAGPVFGTISDKVSSLFGSNYTMDLDGTGVAFDFKVGAVVNPNVILHATLISETMTGPNIKISDNPTVKASDKLTVGEAMMGAGLTYYFPPHNFFLSGSLGIGNFTIMDETNRITTYTQYGLAYQLKAGKEWWVSSKWGLGFSLTYNRTNLTNHAAGDTEKLDSNRFGILFNATLN